MCKGVAVQVTPMNAEVKALLHEMECAFPQHFKQEGAEGFACYYPVEKNRLKGTGQTALYYCRLIANEFPQTAVAAFLCSEDAVLQGIFPGKVPAETE